MRVQLSYSQGKYHIITALAAQTIILENTVFAHTYIAGCGVAVWRALLLLLLLLLGVGFLLGFSHRMCILHIYHHHAREWKL